MPRPPERQHHLEQLLHEGHELSLGEICASVGITSKRQARRLLAGLREKGLPIEDRQQGGIKRFFVPPEHRQVQTSAISFEEEEMLALAVASEAARAALTETPLGAPLRRAFDKLLDQLAPEAVLFEVEDEPARWHFGSQVAGQIDPAVFRVLQRATGEHRSVRIDYHTASSGIFSQNRKINPLQLVRYRGSWSVVAWCHKRQDVRDFALAGIERVVPCDDAQELAFFSPPDDFDPATYYRDRFAAVAGDRLYTVRLQVQADRAPYFQRKKYHPSQQARALENGALEVVYEVAGLNEVRSFVQSWGVGVTVLDPPELVDIIANEARELVVRYSKGENI